jgi:hypothetical protein
MSILQEFRRDEARVLDRLVDGELSQHDRRELLAALDDEPGAWRRCALAFLEAQTWRWQMAQAAAEPLVVQMAQPTNRAPGEPGAQHRASWGAWLAIAAALFVAFGVGMRFPLTSRLGDRDDAAATNMAQGEPASRPGAIEAVGKTEPATSSLAGAQSNTADDELVETVTLAPVDGGDAGQEFQVAVVKDDATDQQWAEVEQSGVASRLLEQLEKAGLKVTRQQRFWPVDLADGRRLVVPVDEVDVSDPASVQY